MHWYIAALTKYADVSGRARRKEYWMFFLFNFLITMGLIILEAFLGISDLEGGWGPISGLYTLAMLVPSIAVGVRRLHDTGRSGWTLLLAIIPIVNLYVLYLMVIDGDPGENEYGPNPKSATAYV